MKTPEGQILIGVSRKTDTQITVTSSRPVHAAQILIGKTPEQALTLIPMLFNICGMAQSHAALSAIQQKTRDITDSGCEAARELLVLAETAREHLLRIHLDWPVLFQQDRQQTSADLPAISQLANRFKVQLFENGQAFAFDSRLHRHIVLTETLIENLETMLCDSVFCLPPQQWYEIHDSDSLQYWLAQCDSIAAKSIKTIIKNNWSAQGAHACSPLPEMDSKTLLQIFNSEEAGGFIASPHWQGNCHETTSLSRQHRHPLIKALQAEFSSGLLTRWVARLLELAQIPQKMRHCLKQATYPRSRMKKTGFRLGIAQIEAARGRLIHQVRLDHGIISAYRILAPTEWNFHPRGLVSESLSRIDVQDQDEWKKLAHLLITTVDPCVGYELRIH